MTDQYFEFCWPTYMDGQERQPRPLKFWNRLPRCPAKDMCPRRILRWSTPVSVTPIRRSAGWRRHMRRATLELPNCRRCISTEFVRILVTRTSESASVSLHRLAPEGTVDNANTRTAIPAKYAGALKYFQWAVTSADPTVTTFGLGTITGF